MEWIRSWIMQIAGIIVLGALCDMIMADGDTKKYVKMVIGLILAFAVIRPIFNISTEKLHIDVPQSAHVEALELSNRLDEFERNKIITLYCRNLEEKIMNEIQKEWICEVWVDVKVEEKDEAEFGNINEVRIVCESLPEGADEDKIIRIVHQRFGVDEDSVKIQIN